METLEQIAMRVEAIRNGTAHDVTAVLKLVSEYFAELAKQEPVAWHCPKSGFLTLSEASKNLWEADGYPMQPLYAAPIPTPEDVRDAERYRKLRRWMTSNVKDGWAEVENLAGVGCYQSYADFDDYLDALPVCNVGLSYRKEDAAMTAAQEGK